MPPKGGASGGTGAQMIEYPELAAIRLGYGLSPLQVPPASPDDLLAGISAAAPDADAIRMARVDRLRQNHARQQQKARQGALKDPAQARRFVLRARQLVIVAQRSRFARAVGDPGGFGERLVQFWADHFTVGAGNSFQTLMAAAFVDEAIRPNLSARFADMMFAAETHPRMLTYLNQNRSFGPNSVIARRRAGDGLGLNENLAREMIELHSLGVGADYTQEDVRQLAELLTGLSYRPDQEPDFRPGIAEPGSETVLGITYGDGTGAASIGDIRAVIGDLAVHPATARHIARKLAVHFVADDPPPGLVDRLEGAFTETGGDLPTLYRVIAEAPELESCFRQKLRQPFDFTVAALRGLGLDREAVMRMPDRDLVTRLIRPLTGMGQKWGMPRGPDGWPEDAAAWATPQGIAARLDWALRRMPPLAGTLPDPRDFLRASLGTTASAALQWAVPRAESAREGVAIVLASADFNRR